MIRVLLCVVAVWSAATTRTFGQAVPVDPHLALARELVEISFSDAVFSSVQEQLVRGSRQTVSPQLAGVIKRQPTAEDMDKLNRAIRSTVETVFPKSAWVDALATMYMKHLSPDDLKQLLKILRSPLGQRLMQAQGRMFSEGPALTQKLFDDRREQFQAVLLENLKKAFAQ